MTKVQRVFGSRPFMFAAVLVLALLFTNVIMDSSFVSSSAALAATLVAMSPLAIVAMASVPSVISGGLDLSIGPLLGLANVLMVGFLLPHGLGDPWISIPIIVTSGAAIGAVNGVLVAYVRLPAVIATLCTLFVITGVSSKIVPWPTTAPDNWTNRLAGSAGPIPVALLVMAVPLLIWVTLGRTPYLRALYSVGGNDVTAFTAGVSVGRTRVIAYALGGMFAAMAGLALTGVIRSADPTLGLQYTLIALAAVALGGTAFGGGRGGLLGPLLGATAIYLMQNLLSELSVSPVWLQVAYGAVLIGAVVVGASLAGVRRQGVAA